MALGDEVKRRRVELGISRGHIARRCGLTIQWMEQFESGQFKETPPISIMFQIAQELQTTTDNLLGLTLQTARNRTVLMNAAMMPLDGIYVRRDIGKAEFVGRLREAHRSGVLKSYIGYIETALHIEEISGIRISVTREDTKITKRDHIIVCKLRKRVSDKRELQYPSINDFQYLEVIYQGKENLS